MASHSFHRAVLASGTLVAAALLETLLGGAAGGSIVAAAAGGVGANFLHQLTDAFGKRLSTLGRAGEAEPLYRDALAMRQRLFAGDHPDVATSLHNLAGVLEALGRAGEACDFMKQAAAMIARLRGADDAMSQEWSTHRDHMCGGGAEITSAG